MKSLHLEPSLLVKLVVIAALANVASAQLTSTQQGSSTSFVIVDANKKVLGPVIATNQGGNIPTVAIKVGDQWLPVAITRNQVLPGNALVYASADCSGQAYGDVAPSAFPASAVVGTALYGPSGAVITSFQVNSSWSWGSCFQNSYVTDVVALSPILDLSKYSPPFTALAVKNQQ